MRELSGSLRLTGSGGSRAGRQACEEPKNAELLSPSPQTPRPLRWEPPPVRAPKGKGRQSRPPARGVAAKSNFLSVQLYGWLSLSGTVSIASAAAGIAGIVTCFKRRCDVGAPNVSDGATPASSNETFGGRIG